ncbi:helix-turn-helix transcriptional regulator [Halobacillus sp. SY10]|uniref:helix-turn-helix transcriptional regulator n=1 Tax=Halobacillus sp. SY10 TaxID=3381356 RepID=UPI0038794B72
MKINLELIKKTRSERDYTIYDLAEHLGLSDGSQYWKRENGHYKFKADELILISQKFDIPIEKLFLSTDYSKTEILSKEVI